MKILRMMISAAAVIVALLLCAFIESAGTSEKAKTLQQEKAVKAYREFVRTGKHEKLRWGGEDRWMLLWTKDGASLLFLSNNGYHDRWEGVQVYTYNKKAGQVCFLGEYGSRGRLWVCPETGTLRVRYGIRGGQDVILRLEEARLKPLRLFAVNAATGNGILYYKADVPEGFGGTAAEEEVLDGSASVNWKRIAERTYNSLIQSYMGDDPIEVQYENMQNSEEFIYRCTYSGRRPE